MDPDLGWHLKVGEQIIEEKSVPNFDYYNYPLSGKKWVDHEWLLNATIYWLYQNFGYLFLNLFFASLIVITLIILNIFTQKSPFLNQPPTFFIMFFQFFGVLAMAPHLGIRMQEFTLINLLLLLIIVYQYNKTKNYKTLIWLLPLFYIWANTHGSFIIGIFIMCLWVGVKIGEIIIKKYHFFKFINQQNNLALKKIALFFFFLCLSVLVTFLTPYGLKLYSFLGDYANTFYMKHIAEWLSAFYLPIQYKQIFYSAIISTVIILLACYSREKKPNTNTGKYKINLWYFMLTILFLCLAFKSKRHFPLLFIVSFPLLIEFCNLYCRLPQKILEIFNKNIFIKSYIVFGFLLVISFFLIKTSYTTNPFTSPVFCQSYPCQAVNFLKNSPSYQNLKIFNKYGWGGFMIWVWPEKKLFIDGRLPQYKFAGHTLLEEYFDFFDEEKVELKLNEYDIKLVLLKLDKKIKINWFEKYVLGLNEKKVNDQKNYLKDYLDNAPEWKLVYNDSISNIYVKN